MGSAAGDPVRVRKGGGGELGERASRSRRNVAGRRSGRVDQGTVMDGCTKDKIHDRVNHHKVGNSRVPTKHVCNNLHSRDIGSSGRRNSSASRGGRYSTHPYNLKGVHMVAEEGIGVLYQT